MMKSNENNGAVTKSFAKKMESISLRIEEQTD
mgnify:CR=1 FL=1